MKGVGGGAQRGRAAGAAEEMSNGCEEVKGTKEREAAQAPTKTSREYQREIKVLDEMVVHGWRRDMKPQS